MHSSVRTRGYAKGIPMGKGTDRFNFIQFLKPMRKNFIALIIFLLSATGTFSQNNVGIGTNSPDSNAILELQTTDKGILIPRMTAVQRNNMSPSLGLTQKGMLVFDNDSTKFFYWNGYSWQTIGSGAIGPQGPTGIANIQLYGINGTSDTVISTSVFTDIPGLSLTITLVAQATLSIFTTGGIKTPISTYSSSSGKIGLFMNNVLVPSAFQSYEMWNYYTIFVYKTNWSFATVLSLPAGTYTFDIRAKLNSGISFYAGANSDSQSSLIIHVFY
jgi:hypothetical protein